ncbi:hypothetical protein O181_035628 [Austropuccinia psidii MF-1]|uniref:Uncharacterized protein n=1 Tax=Austropuccinia psidii MF-1 TaxID=1389203 RepID=A0A9Q3D7V1_9BASI|nr:hypothetical protein [Austropuccinia psidii MF-1]
MTCSIAPAQESRYQDEEAFKEIGSKAASTSPTHRQRLATKIYEITTIHRVFQVLSMDEWSRLFKDRPKMEI